MENSIIRKTEIEDVLKELREKKMQLETRLNTINNDIKEKISMHNSLVASVSNVKKEYKDKLQKFNTLKTLIKEYKKKQREILENEYQLEIRRIIEELNGLVFTFKISVFKAFDQVKGISTSHFPILNLKKNELFDENRINLKEKLIHEVELGLTGKTSLPDLIFHINFLIKYEMYFCEDVFMDFLLRNIEKEFEYHFLTDRATNRLDKPEWIFDFLLKKYSEFEPVIGIYSECRIKAGIDTKDITQLILDSQRLIIMKIHEISKTDTNQRRGLILNFISKFNEYSNTIRNRYSLDVNSDDVKHVLSNVQTEYIKNELQRIHELRYVQWFIEYKKLCRDSLVYINKYGVIDTEFKFKNLTKLIISHMKSFIENLRFINREEINVVLFVFNEIEDLKAFLMQEEGEIALMTESSKIDITASSIDKIAVFNAEIFKLIKKLAASDVENILRKIYSFTYSSNEVRRTTLVEINKIMDEYGFCVYSDLIHKAIQERIDEILVKEILSKIKFTPDEYLEFKGFFRILKKYVQNFQWKADEVCKCIDAIFEERFEDGLLFKQFKDFYGR